MSRIIVRFKDEKDGYMNVEGTDITEENDYIKIYGTHTELLGVFHIECIKQVYKTEVKK